MPKLKRGVNSTNRENVAAGQFFATLFPDVVSAVFGGVKQRFYGFGIKLKSLRYRRWIECAPAALALPAKS